MTVESATPIASAVGTPQPQGRAHYIIVNDADERHVIKAEIPISVLHDPKSFVNLVVGLVEAGLRGNGLDAEVPWKYHDRLAELCTQAFLATIGLEAEPEPSEGVFQVLAADSSGSLYYAPDC